MQSHRWQIEASVPIGDHPQKTVAQDAPRIVPAVLDDI
jgi:hypothetical protein